LHSITNIICLFFFFQILYCGIYFSTENNTLYHSRYWNFYNWSEKKNLKIKTPLTKVFANRGGLQYSLICYFRHVLWIKFKINCGIKRWKTRRCSSKTASFLVITLIYLHQSSVCFSIRSIEELSFPCTDVKLYLQTTVETVN